MATRGAWMPSSVDASLKKIRNQGRIAGGKPQLYANPLRRRQRNRNMTDRDTLELSASMLPFPAAMSQAELRAKMIQMGVLDSASASSGSGSSVQSMSRSLGSFEDHVAAALNIGVLKQSMCGTEADTEMMAEWPGMSAPSLSMSSDSSGRRSASLGLGLGTPPHLASRAGVGMGNRQCVVKSEGGMIPLSQEHLHARRIEQRCMGVDIEIKTLREDARMEDAKHTVATHHLRSLNHKLQKKLLILQTMVSHIRLNKRRDRPDSMLKDEDVSSGQPTMRRQRRHGMLMGSDQGVGPPHADSRSRRVRSRLARIQLATQRAADSGLAPGAHFRQGDDRDGQVSQEMQAAAMQLAQRQPRPGANSKGQGARPGGVHRANGQEWWPPMGAMPSAAAAVSLPASNGQARGRIPGQTDASGANHPSMREIDGVFAQLSEMYRMQRPAGGQDGRGPEQSMPMPMPMNQGGNTNNQQGTIISQGNGQIAMGGPPGRFAQARAQFPDEETAALVLAGGVMRPGVSKGLEAMQMSEQPKASSAEQQQQRSKLMTSQLLALQDAAAAAPDQ